MGPLCIGIIRIYDASDADASDTAADEADAASVTAGSGGCADGAT
jgi:hypothetical protein